MLSLSFFTNLFHLHSLFPSSLVFSVCFLFLSFFLFFLSFFFSLFFLSFLFFLFCFCLFYLFYLSFFLSFFLSFYYFFLYWESIPYTTLLSTIWVAPIFNSAFPSNYWIYEWFIPRGRFLTPVLWPTRFYPIYDPELSCLVLPNNWRYSRHNGPTKKPVLSGQSVWAGYTRHIWVKTFGPVKQDWREPASRGRGTQYLDTNIDRF